MPEFPENNALSERAKKYQQDIQKIKDQEENLKAIRNQLKSELCPHFTHLIGIFGHYKHRFSDGRTGNDVIDYIANQVTKTNKPCLIITGNYYYRFSEKQNAIIRERILQDTLQEFVNDEAINSIGYSRILASICNMAIFLMTPARSTSAFEEVEFSSDVFEHNIFGLGVYVINPEESAHITSCECYAYKKIPLPSGISYLLCDGIMQEIPYCQGCLHKINHATIELFIKRNFLSLIISESWQNVPEIFEYIKNSLLQSN